MKTIILSTLMLFLCTGLFAQKKTEYQLTPAFPVTVDGDLSEWRNKLSPVDADSSWSFAVSQDADFFYIAIQVKDKMLQQDAARHGFIVNINTEGKKKEGAQLFYPIPDSESIRALSRDDNLANMNIREELIKRSRGYGLKGFAHIVDGLLSFENTYDVKAFAKLNEQDQLLYEAMIPIKAIGFKRNQEKFALQLAINNRFVQLQKAMRKAPPQRVGIYGMQPQTSLKNPYKVKTEVWMQGHLNKN